MISKDVDSSFDCVNVEYKFVGRFNKTGAQVLKNTNDGKQGSMSWIAGSNRIENAVGGVTVRQEPQERKVNWFMRLFGKKSP